MKGFVLKSCLAGLEHEGGIVWYSVSCTHSNRVLCRREQEGDSGRMNGTISKLLTE